MRWRRAWKASPSLSWRPISRRWRWAPPGSPDRRRPSTKPGRAGRRSVRRPPPGSVTARHRPGPRHPTASPISHRTRAGRAYAQGAGPAAPQDEAAVILQGNGRFPADDPACGNGPRSAPGAGNDHRTAGAISGHVPWERRRPAPHPGSGTASGGRALRGAGSSPEPWRRTRHCAPGGHRDRGAVQTTASTTRDPLPPLSGQVLSGPGGGRRRGGRAWWWSGDALRGSAKRDDRDAVGCRSVGLPVVVGDDCVEVVAEVEGGGEMNGVEGSDLGR